MTTKDDRSLRSARSTRGTSGSVTAALAFPPRQPGSGRVPAARSDGPEPSWGRVLLTTVELWLSRRLRPVRLPRRRRLALAVAALTVAALLALALVTALSGTAPRSARPPAARHPAARSAAAELAAAAQSQAVAWIVGQVSSAAVIGCDPALCTALQAHGLEASRLMPLGSGMAGVLQTDVTATLPSASQKLLDEDAPALIASFGSGRSRIEVRAVAPGGAAAYQSAARTDRAARQSAGTQLLASPRLRFSPANAARLRAGDVDSRLLATLAALSSQFKLQVTAFGDSSPGVPAFFREVAVTSDGGKNAAAQLAAAQALVNAQEGPYQPALCTIRPQAGRPVLFIGFASPTPLGLLNTVLTAHRG